MDQIAWAKSILRMVRPKYLIDTEEEAKAMFLLIIKDLAGAWPMNEEETK